MQELLPYLGLALGALSAIGLSGIFGEVIGAALGWAGEKPKVPDFIETDVQKEQAKAIQGNIAMLPDIGRISEFAAQQRAKDIETLTPGTQALQGSTLDLINQMIRGELPTDVEKYLERKGAERAIASGTGGSVFAGQRTLRDLGMTSLQMQQQGLGAAERWISRAQAAPTFDFGSMLISPTFQSQFAFQQNAARQQQQWLSNQIAAMPSPLENAMMSSLRKFDDLTWQVAGTAAGGAMGGVMGGGGGGSSSAPQAPLWNYNLNYSNPATGSYVAGVQTGAFPNPWE